ncbi:MAG: DegT/DnrJ/EryC1/StrS family aminotransferase [Kiritimatiellae bacterium]|nr:DegT/DnrJ/EryC1/StrS family aminotransferase [Kiritimatiellia bacterium]
MSNTNRIFLSPPYTGEAERAAVAAAFDSGYVAPCGPQTDEFERRLAELSGRRYAVAVSSGTAAIDLLMDEFGIDSSWTVIAPTLTFIATVGPAWHRGAKLAFVDSDATGGIDVSLLGEALGKTPGKKLVISVDLYGNCADYDAITALCRRHGAVYISDSAEAVGAKYGGRPAGSAGAAAVYSFNGNKIITTSGGGAILTDSRAIAERARKRSQQSREKRIWYEHREVGYNYRLSNILAAIGLAQLDRLPEILKIRAKTAEWYAKRLPVPLPAGGNRWLSVAFLDSRRARDTLLKRFAEANIEARPFWKPLHLQPVFAGAASFGTEVAESMFERGICLPSGTGMTQDDFGRIERCLGEREG